MPAKILDPWLATVWKIVRTISRESGHPATSLKSVSHVSGYAIRIEWSPYPDYVLEVYSSPDRTVTDGRITTLRKLLAKENSRG